MKTKSPSLIRLSGISLSIEDESTAFCFQLAIMYARCQVNNSTMKNAFELVDIACILSF